MDEFKGNPFTSKQFIIPSKHHRTRQQLMCGYSHLVLLSRPEKKLDLGLQSLYHWLS
jgi:hypothetical protein